MWRFSGALAVFLLAAGFFAAAGVPVTRAQDIAPERIQNFSVQVQLQENGALQVVETIVYDFGFAERHGIYRDLPLKYDSGRGNLAVTDISVTDASGSPYPIDISKSGGFLSIRIGDPDVLVTGVKTYVVNYRADGAVQWGENADRLIWNVTGNGWEVLIEKTEAKLVLPPAVSADSVAYQCYQGAYGSTEPCTIGDLFTASRPLGPGEGLTFSVDLPKGILTPPTAGGKILGFLTEHPLIFLPFVVFLFMFQLWWRKGRDPKGRGTIIPQYEPPDGLSPLEVGALAAGKIKPEHISAEIISLAVRGYLKIVPVGDKSGDLDDYKLEKIKDISEEAPFFDRILITGLFTAGMPTSLMDFAKLLKKVKDKSEEEAMLAFQSEHGTDSSTTLSGLKNKFHTVVQVVKDQVFKDLMAKGYYEHSPNKIVGKYVVAAFVLGWLGAFFFGGGSGWNVLGIAVSAIIIAVFGALMPKVTPQGALAKEHIAGFRDYLDIAEKDRLNFHNAPEKTPELFEKFLPYALALGVVDAWAKEFQGIYTEPPQWYGGHPTGTFLAVGLAHDLGRFSSISARTALASSSGGGGGSGGSFSGGGAGGGGGGSW